MNVLIVGGYKGPILEGAVRKKFEGSPVKLSVGNYMEGAVEAFKSGESYDRIIFMESGWNRDGDIKDEEILRHALYEFNESYIENGMEGTEIVFVTDTPESANIVYEETIQISENTAVYFMDSVMSVGLAKKLIVADLSGIDNMDMVLELLENRRQDEEAEIEVEEAEETEEVDVEETEEVEVEETEDEEPEEEDGFDFDFEGDDFGSAGLGEDSGFKGFDDIGELDFDDDSEDDLELREDSEEDDFDFDGESDFDFDEVSDGQFGGFGGDSSKEFEGFGLEDEKEKENSDSVGDPFADFEGDGFEIEEEEVTEFKGFDEIAELEEAFAGFDEEEEEEEVLEEKVYEVPEPVVTTNTLREDIEEAKSISHNAYIEEAEPIENDEIDLNDYKTPVKGKKRKGQKPIDYNEMKIRLDAYASRGTSIAITGAAASGKTFVAYNMANVLNKMGYNVLLVDFDLNGRGQSYISRETYKSVEIDGVSVVQALKNANRANGFVSVVRPGFNVLTNGVGGTPVDLDKVATDENLLRFISTVKNSYSFVIYDIPFENAVGSVKEVLYSADDVIVVSEGSQYGVSKTIINMGNIEDLDLMEHMFSKGKLMFNKIDASYTIFGKKIKKVWDYLSIMDSKLNEWAGESDGVYFQNMEIVGVVNTDPLVEKAWFTSSPYSGKDPGRAIFIQLLWNLV